MTERYYTYTVSHCSKAIKYGLYWLISELEKYKAERGCILAIGKGNFCIRSTKVYKEGLGENFVKEMWKEIIKKKQESESKIKIQLENFIISNIKTTFFFTNINFKKSYISITCIIKLKLK